MKLLLCLGLFCLPMASTHAGFADLPGTSSLFREKRALAQEEEGFLFQDGGELEPMNAKSEEEDEDSDEEGVSEKSNYYDFLYKRMKQSADEPQRKRVVLKPTPYTIPGPQEPLPGRSHPGNYWPVFPFQSQFSGGLDLDPSISRHIGGDLNLAIPSWGILDIYGRFFNRIHDTTTKFGYVAHPVNMLDLEREDLVKLMTDPSLQANRNIQPTVPLGKLAKTYVPLSCKPPLCNPYQANFGFGVEQDKGGSDGVEGDIDVPIPISKGVAYRFPFSGKVYYAYDNITITYGQNLNPIDPSSLFEYQKYRDPGLAIPRSRREISNSQKVWQSESDAKSFSEHLQKGYEADAERYMSNVPPETKTNKYYSDFEPTQSTSIPRKDFEHLLTSWQLRRQRLQKPYRTTVGYPYTNLRNIKTYNSLNYVFDGYDPSLFTVWNQPMDIPTYYGNRHFAKYQYPLPIRNHYSTPFVYQQPEFYMNQYQRFSMYQNPSFYMKQYLPRRVYQYPPLMVDAYMQPSSYQYPPSFQAQYPSQNPYPSYVMRQNSVPCM